MRRRDRGRDRWPRWMTHYQPQDWPQAACHPECAYWAAVRRWVARHPGGVTPVGVGPDGAFHPEQV